ncbi:hypothetical protein KC19_4G211200 [Ceratodon purpureus]|uniref:Uncharacterized protein n=1 Tax=Ceratodon purpureus TaxID=3225 RepID=A0A8T0IEM3_CERPU|nr:hypothetical protein KC19_4G211200 [Ceratodon purpureus]
MKEVTFASRLSQTAHGAFDFLVATIPKDVMHAFEIEEEASTPLTAPKEQIPDAAPLSPWGTRLLHQVCPHRLITHPRANLLAVAGLLLTGALVIYMTALHMGYLSSEEAALLSTFNQTSPYLNTSRVAPPPLSVNDSGLSDNSSVGNQSAFDYNATTQESSQVANVSIPDTGAQAPSNSSIGDSALDYSNTNVTTGESSQVSNFSAPVPSPEEGIVERAPPSPPSLSPPPPPPSPPPPSALAQPTDARIYYQNMSETWHTMSDRALLRKASSIPQVQTPHVGKVAYMFMTRGPLPFAPLWERYFRGHEQLYSIYIHAHPAYVPTLAPTSPFFGRFIPSKLVQWGKLSVYRAERRLLGNALLDERNEWFLLLSESCVPIFSFPDTYTYLNNSQGISFIESYKDSSRAGQGRLYRGRYKDMAPEITEKNFRKGSQWFQINRDLALLTAANSVEYTKFEQYFCKIHPVCYIDEHFLPTFAWIKRSQAIAFRTLTYYEFRGKSPHPKLFGKADIDAKLILDFRGAGGHTCTYNGQPTSQCYMFVRKFDPDALDALLDLAGPVMGIP